VYIIGTGDAGNRIRTTEDILKRKPDFSLAALPPRRYKSGLPVNIDVGV
jgi:hypothetical protein